MIQTMLAYAAEKRVRAPHKGAFFFFGGLTSLTFSVMSDPISTASIVISPYFTKISGR
jgi:hypothetical protein